MYERQEKLQKRQEKEKVVNLLRLLGMDPDVI